MSETTIRVSDDHARATVQLGAVAQEDGLTAGDLDHLIRQLISTRLRMTPRIETGDPKQGEDYLPAVRMFTARIDLERPPKLQILLLVPGLGWTGISLDGDGKRDMMAHSDQMLANQPAP